MDLVLEFRDGTMLGEGWDDIGLFDIDGRYSTENLTCSWKKMYYRKHTVHYEGSRVSRGIRGTWTLRGIQGDFHIWPIGATAALDIAQSAISEEVPLTAQPVTVPNLR